MASSPCGRGHRWICPGSRLASQEPIRRHLRRPENGIDSRREDLRGDRAQGAAHRHGRSALPARAAGTLAAGWEPELRLAVEIIFPTWLLLECFARFAEDRPETRIELYETVLSGTEEALLERRVDLAICSEVPRGFVGDFLMRVRFIPVAHPDHPLHRLGRALTLQELRKHRHLVIRDTGSQRRGGTWLGAEQIWTVSHKATSIHAAVMGLGFAWYPEELVRGELGSGTLKALPLREGTERWGNLYLVFADRDYAGPGAIRLAEIIREAVRPCRKAEEDRGI
jgi:DNA-binding transcriptional LysR family regulator